MQKIMLFLFAFLWAGQIACAEGNLQLIGETKSLPAGVDEICSYMIQVASTDKLNLAQPSAWQMVCTLIPIDGATGVRFKSASQPSGYVFDEVLNSFIDNTEYDSVTGYPTASGSIGPIIGWTDSGEGIEVPAEGKNLLQLELAVSATAKGRFDIAVLPDADLDNGDNETVTVGSCWYTYADSGRWAFEGMAFGGDPVVIGSVSIIPEPSSAWLLLSGALIFIAGVALNAVRKGPLGASHDSLAPDIANER